MSISLLAKGKWYIKFINFMIIVVIIIISFIIIIVPTCRRSWFGSLIIFALKIRQLTIGITILSVRGKKRAILLLTRDCFIQTFLLKTLHEGREKKVVALAVLNGTATNLSCWLVNFMLHFRMFISLLKRH